MRHATTIFCLAISLGFVGSAGAQSVFTATGGSGGQGATVDSFVLFDTTENSQGWSFGVCHDGDNLTLIDSVEGMATLTVNNGSPPDFVAINTDPTAPIFDIAQYGAEVDVLDLIEVLTEQVQEVTGG